MSQSSTDALQEFAATIGERDAPSLVDMLAFWKNYRIVGNESPEGFAKMGQAFIQCDEHLIGHDVVHAGIDLHKTDTRLRQLHALALIHTGAIQRANAALIELRREGHRDNRTLGMLGRTYRDLADEAVSPDERRVLLIKSYDCYYDAYRRSTDAEQPAIERCWPGINAASTALLARKTETAKKLAMEVRDMCRPEVTPPDTASSYWLLATLGEAALILGEPAQAEEAYGRAGKVAGDRFSYVQGSRRNARRLLEHWNLDLGLLDRCLPVPRVVAFVGHMVDRPERTSRRFPAWLEKDVAAALRVQLKNLRAGFGFCSMACGSDILFAEAMLEMGGKVHVVMPHDQEQFIKESVDFIHDSDWKMRCEAALARSIHITKASEHSSTREGKQYEYSNQVLQGLAMQRARYFDQTAAGLAVWDGCPGDGSGGTSWTVDLWRKSGLEVAVIDLAKILREKSHEEAAESALPTGCRPMKRRSGAFIPEIRGLLFADAEGFSKLSEDQVLLFVKHFLTLVAKTAARFQKGVLLSNTWGDGLYFVLADVRTAGMLALELCDQVAATKWEEKGLPRLNLRIGVHAGPVYDCTDPVTDRRNFIGAHVSRAARIEPIAPTGAVYSSEQFAALAAVEGVSEFRCDYVGQARMAKGYGIFPTYVVRRWTAAAPKRQEQASARA